MQALSFLKGTGGSRAFNLGTGHPISVRQVIAAVERVLGTKVPTVEASRRPATRRACSPRRVLPDAIWAGSLPAAISTASSKRPPAGVGGREDLRPATGSYDDSSSYSQLGAILGDY